MILVKYLWAPIGKQENQNGQPPPVARVFQIGLFQPSNEPEHLLWLLTGQLDAHYAKGPSHYWARSISVQATLTAPPKRKRQTTPPPPPVNVAPVAVNDAYAINCSTASTFNVLVNDSDKDGDALTITSVSTPGKGTATISAGRIVYTANASTCGGTTDSFTYTISDGKGGTATATVAVTINNTTPPPPANNAPVAVGDLYIVPCRSTAVLDVLSNDSDKDGDPLTITAITQPSRAAISIAANGKSLLYTPGAACFVNDTFTYTISDGKGGTATATVTLIDP